MNKNQFIYKNQKHMIIYNYFFRITKKFKSYFTLKIITTHNITIIEY